MKYSPRILTFLSMLGAGSTASVYEESPKPPQIMKPTPEPYRIDYNDGSVSPLIKIRIREQAENSSPRIWEETLDGFTVGPATQKGKEGKYTYRDVDLNTGELIDTGLVAGKDDPSSKNVHKHAATEGEKLKITKSTSANPVFKDKNNNNRRLGEPGKIPGEAVEDQSHHRRTTITSGTLKNLVVPIRFSDHRSRSLPSRADLDILMNSEVPTAQCPSGSVRDMYLKSSFNQLAIDSTVVDWVTIDFTEAYCANGNSGLSRRIFRCLTNALDKVVASGVVNFRDFDVDEDGWMDGMTFFHSGYAAEWGGNDADGTNYANRIWSHKWSIYSTDWSNNGVQVWDYHINPSLWARSGNDIGRIGVVAHETGHFLGLPDLYDYGDPTYGDGEGIGSWGLMANSWGFDGSQYHPPHMSAWSKYVLGWVSPTVVSSTGTYTLRQACDHADMIMITEGYPSGEYLLIENRQPCGFETTMSQGGLAIFHVDDKANNILGHPNQNGWPQNANHYEVALLQADSSFGLEKSFNRGDSGDVFHAGGVNSIGPAGTSAGLQYPNTKAYQGGTIIDTEVTISKIGAAGFRMSFEIAIGNSNDTSSPTRSPTSSPTANIGQNVALGKPTSQTGTAHGGVSSRAVDGNTSGNYWDDSVTHTPAMSNPSWSVNLTAKYSINQIRIFNRSDCCNARLSGFKVIIWNGSTEAWVYTHSGGTPPRETTLNVAGVEGNKVEVMIPGSSEILSLAEVEVFGTYVGIVDTEPPTSAPTASPTANIEQNVALGKPTTQSGTAHGGVSSRAVDGNTSGNYWDDSVTHTPSMSNPSWSVNLTAKYSINQIRIFNRSDCCNARLSGFKVIIWNGSTEAWVYTHSGGTPPRETTLNVAGVEGNKVEVMIPGSSEILSLAEVEVFGTYVTGGGDYVEVTSEDCETYGYETLTSEDECTAAATAIGRTITWGPHGGYTDVVTGCSARFSYSNTNLFFNNPGICDPNDNIGHWTYTGCKCTDWMPCICRMAMSRPTCSDSPLSFIVTMDGNNRRKTCDWAGNNVHTNCAYGGVSKTCPMTCGTCSTCVNSPLTFKVNINGTESNKRCGWAGRNPSTNCAFDGVKETCREACGKC